MTTLRQPPSQQRPAHGAFASICAHCGHPAQRSPCADCQRQEQQLHDQPTWGSPRKEPPCIAAAMGPLPEPPQQATTQDAPTAPQALGYKCEAMPDAWRDYRPDMSGISYVEPLPLTPATITHTTIQRCLLDARVVMKSDHTQHIYGSEPGVHDDDARRSMAKFMARHGGIEYLPGFWRLQNNTMMLRLVAQIGKPRTGVVIELRDYTLAAPFSPSALLSVDGGGDCELTVVQEPDQPPIQVTHPNPIRALGDADVLMCDASLVMMSDAVCAEFGQPVQIGGVA